ncbi:hypothetical protein BDW02DRAFT_227050 [Decorospora gaudefroyi]|uniref:Uncharacterized protein n=1 Tax=Decorospora gaudefroyi TaxID=184978 RepID=A0A6A5JVT9_9PLEO|nr:hypothetical protein BDW02DRAFT_227050 [Decorospora gaudefroyi]
MSDSNETTLLICFGIFTLMATLASLHYRDSLCCLFCRSLMRAWSRIPDTDVEAMAGMQHGLRRALHEEDEAIIELQPRPSFPLYFDSALRDTGTGEITASVRETIAPTPPQSD